MGKSFFTMAIYTNRILASVSSGIFEAANYDMGVVTTLSIIALILNERLSQ